MEEERNQEIDVKTEVEESKERKILKLPEKNQESDKIFDMENATEEEIEKEARKWGHISKEDHKGDPSKWQDPREFLERSLRESPAHIKQIKKQNRVIETQNKIIENLKKDIERQRENLKPKMKEAFENANYDEYKKLQDEDAHLKEQKIEYDKHTELPEENNINAYAEEAERWIRQNPDYYTNLEIRKKADKAFDDFRADFPNATPRQIIQAVDMVVKAGRQKATSFKSTQSNPSVMASKSKERSYDNLTASAKRVCDSFQEFNVKKEDYVKNASDDCFVWGK
jgi:hypothetical protein